jgi:hypothetical protein
MSQHRLDTTTADGQATWHFWENAYSGELTQEELQQLHRQVRPLDDFTSEEINNVVAIVAGKAYANSIYEQYFMPRLRPPAAELLSYGQVSWWPLLGPQQAPSPNHAQFVEETAMPLLLSGIQLWPDTTPGVGDGSRVILVMSFRCGGDGRMGPGRGSGDCEVCCQSGCLCISRHTHMSVDRPFTTSPDWRVSVAALTASLNAVLGIAMGGTTPG